MQIVTLNTRLCQFPDYPALYHLPECLTALSDARKARRNASRITVLSSVSAARACHVQYAIWEPIPVHAVLWALSQVCDRRKRHVAFAILHLLLGSGDGVAPGVAQPPFKMLGKSEGQHILTNPLVIDGIIAKVRRSHLPSHAVHMVLESRLPPHPDASRSGTLKGDRHSIGDRPRYRKYDGQNAPGGPASLWTVQQNHLQLTLLLTNAGLQEGVRG